MVVHDVSATSEAADVVGPFRAGGDFTVGVEDELLLVDRDGELVSGPTASVIAGLERDPALTSRAGPEIYACEIEFATPVCRDGAEAATALARCRAALGDVGQDALAVGIHPAAPFGEVSLVSSPRYDAIKAEYAGFLRTATAALQVHVAVPDGVAMVRALRGIRPLLPVLRGLAAGSPFWHGRDSGLASARAAVQRSYPRIGVPPAFGSYDEYQSHATALLAAAEAPGPTYLWWDARPQPALGTIEVRVMDAQWSLPRVAGLVTLIQGLVRAAVEDPPRHDLPDGLIDESDFRAVRYGLDARILDADGRLRPLRDLAREAIERAAGALADVRLGGLLEPLTAALADEPEYERQRRVHAASGMTALLEDLARRTMSGGA